MTKRLIRKTAALLAAAAALGGVGVAIAAAQSTPATQQALCVQVGHLKVCPLNS